MKSANPIWELIVLPLFVWFVFAVGMSSVAHADETRNSNDQYIQFGIQMELGGPDHGKIKYSVKRKRVIDYSHGAQFIDLSVDLDDETVDEFNTSKFAKAIINKAMGGK